MKLIIAFIQAHRLDAVRQALEKVPGLPGMSVVDVRGFGREKVSEPAHSSAESVTDYTEHVRVEVFARDQDLAAIVAAIRNAARTGRRGDGKVYTLALESALRIRTAEEADDAV